MLKKVILFFLSSLSISYSSMVWGNVYDILKGTKKDYDKEIADSIASEYDTTSNGVNTDFLAAYDYIMITGMGDDLFCVRLADKYGVIDLNGNVMIPIIYEVLDAFGLKEDKPIMAKYNGKWGYIDVNGNIVIPFIYETAGRFNYFSDNRDLIAPVSQGGKYGYVDVHGNEIVPLQFDFADEFEMSSMSYECVHFSIEKEYFALIVKDGLLGIIDNSLQADFTVFEKYIIGNFKYCPYILFDSFREGLDEFLMRHVTNYNDLVEGRGIDKLLAPKEYMQLNLLATLQWVEIVWTEEGYRLVDCNGKYISHSIFDECECSGDITIDCRKEKKMYYFDRKGKRYRSQRAREKVLRIPF